MKRSRAADLASVLALAAILLLALAASGQQAIQSRKKQMTHVVTQSQLSNQKMDCADEMGSQTAAQNSYAFEKKQQIQTAAQKMSRSGRGNSGSQESSGDRDRNGGNG